MAVNTQIDISFFKDIQPIETIPVDFTLYFSLITICILIFSFILYLLTKNKTVKLTQKELTIKKLKSIDFNNFDTKKIIYNFTIYGKESLDTKYKEKFEKILCELEPYKYIKDSKQLTTKVQNSMKNYIKDIELCK